jgi:hypothetical protein
MEVIHCTGVSPPGLVTILATLAQLLRLKHAVVYLLLQCKSMEDCMETFRLILNLLGEVHSPALKG